MEQGVSTKGCGEVCACLEKKERTLIEEISRYENEIVRLDENMTVTDAYRKMNRIEYEEN